MEPAVLEVEPVLIMLWANETVPARRAAHIRIAMRFIDPSLS
jgi:hypothetical protein